MIMLASADGETLLWAEPFFLRRKCFFRYRVKLVIKFNPPQEAEFGRFIVEAEVKYCINAKRTMIIGGGSACRMLFSQRLRLTASAMYRHTSGSARRWDRPYITILF